MLTRAMSAINDALEVHALGLYAVDMGTKRTSQYTMEGTTQRT